MDALLTDLYQLTMAYGYWKQDLADREAVFYYTFRNHPFGGTYTLSAGLEPFINYIESFAFKQEDLEYLKTLQDNVQKPLFETDFLDYLGSLKLSVTIDAVPEGTSVYPGEPVIRVKGPLLQAQLLESPLLNTMNFATLIATKAARVVEAARGDLVLDFGMRRAQGPNGAMTVARSSFIGGCVGTSLVAAGREYGIPVKGTQAHSWIMAYEDELVAFREFAEVMPDNTVFLIDTYHTADGIEKAIEVGKELRLQGKPFVGVRLDSGDLSELSKLVREKLDASGFVDTKIFASSDLDEERIATLKACGAPIDVWGVGTRLATAHGQPALEGVYKLCLLKNIAGDWEGRMKLSDQPGKKSLPGMLQVWRTETCDIIYDERDGIPEAGGKNLLVRVFENGQCCYTIPKLSAIQKRARQELRSAVRQVKVRIDESSITAR